MATVTDAPRPMFVLNREVLLQLGSTTEPARMVCTEDDTCTHEGCSCNDCTGNTASCQTCFQPGC